MGEVELYRELGQLTKDKSRWEEKTPYVSSFLSHDSVKIRAKALWLLGEMGLAHPESVHDTIPAIAAFISSPEPLLRERAANAMGRIGRADFSAIESYFEDLFRLADDENAKVRLAFVWASENIATNTPGVYADRMPIFEKLLHDENDKVRMETPEMFRVLGKRRPELVMPYIEQLRRMAKADENRVVRIHCEGAIRATEKAVSI
ncbi:MAG: HEAT repeat domain-containing protein [Atopobiaceae bacterium]|nr:HEAT repeat domain-containing protein [Atopobiaceae bacterium]